MSRSLNTGERRAVIAVVVVAAACATALAYGRLASARADAQAARIEHAAVLADATKAARLSGAQAVLGERQRPQTDLVASVQRRLAEVGVPAQAVTQVAATPAQPVGAQRAADRRWLRQQATVTLEALRPPDVARFLAAWRDAEPLWVVRSVALQHAGRQRQGPPDFYHATVVLESVFVDAGRSSISPAASPKIPAEKQP